MRNVALAVVMAVGCSHTAALAQANCTHLIEIGQAASTRIAHLDARYGQIASLENKSQAVQVVRELARSYRVLTRVVGSSQDANCATPDFLVEAQSLATESMMRLLQEVGSTPGPLPAQDVAALDLGS
jgi:hypothetical protein